MKSLPMKSARMGFWGRLGVRSHILLTVIGVVLLGFGVMYFVAARLLENSLRSDHEERALGMAQLVAADLGRSVSDQNELAQIFSDWATVLKPGCIGVFDAEGRPRGGTRDELLRCLDEAQLYALGTEFATHRLRSVSGSHVIVQVPVPPSGLRRVLGRAGRVVYAVSVDDLDQRLSTMHTLILLFMALAVILVTVLGYAILTKLIISPLSRLRRAFGRVEAGERQVVASTSGGRELIDLAEAFNALTTHLQADEKRIALQISELKLINQKLAEAQDGLVRSEKLASVGKLAAGVAHEIGNPLSIVVGYLEMMRRPDCTREEQGQYLEQCVEAIHRISGIIQDLLDFSRPERGAAVGRADLRQVLEQSEALMRPQKPFKRVELSVRVEADDDDELVVAIEEGRLQQVLVNLLMNAADACLGDESRSEPLIQIIAERDGDRVLVRVVDNGPGIPESVRARIFDPFFTTKEPGQGTGLGLAIAHSIISASGGDLRVNSKLGEGTCFTLDLATH